jgi:hypothetical protein
MHTYKVFLRSNYSITVYADYVEPKGEWLLFYDDNDQSPMVVFTCSNENTEYTTLIDS